MAAFPNLVLTNAGIALQNKVQGGATLELTNIQMGSGELNGQPIGLLTALISPNATVSIQGGQAIGQNTYQVKGFFTNVDLSAGFWWREVGIFANDPDKGEILYAYANAGDAGDYIPTVTDQRIEKYIYFSMALANATTVNVTIPQTDTFVLKTEVGQPGGVAGLGDNGAVPIPQGGTGATTAQAALAALGAGVRPNELDNAYFAGGGTGWGVFPVNQRGVSGTISTPGYFIDRWKLVSGTVQITSAGLVLNGTIAQILPSSIGSVYTATALTTTGVVTCQYEDASRTFSITGTGQTFIFAKLEKGLGQTATYQDADSAWHLLPQPESNYATQMERCQQYALIFNCRETYAAYLGIGYCERATQYRFMVPTPVTMRTAPVVSFSGNVVVIAHGATIEANSLQVFWDINTNSINVFAEVPGGGIVGENAALAIASKGQVIFDANF